MSNGLVSGSNVLVSRFVAPVVDTDFLKAHIQLTHDLDDALVIAVGGYLDQAAEFIEGRASVALLRQTRKQFIGPELLGSLSGQTVTLTVVPLLSGLVVKYLDTNEATQTLASTYYRVTGTDVYFKMDPPPLADGPGTLWIEYDAGYGESAADIPAAYRSLVCMMAMRLYDYRGSAPKDSDAFERMLDRHIVIAGGNRRY